MNQENISLREEVCATIKKQLEIINGSNSSAAEKKRAALRAKQLGDVLVSLKECGIR